MVAIGAREGRAVTRAEMIAKLHRISLCGTCEACNQRSMQVLAFLESEAEELRRVRDGIRQDAKAILIKSEQSGDSLGVDHVATRSLDYAACAMMTWAEDLSKLIGVEK